MDVLSFIAGFGAAWLLLAAGVVCLLCREHARDERNAHRPLSRPEPPVAVDDLTDAFRGPAAWPQWVDSSNVFPLHPGTVTSLAVYRRQRRGLDAA